jgi:hypothetical protein
MPIPSMYQDHQYTIRIYVSQPSTNLYHAPSINMFHNLYHQPCTITCSNHARQPYTISCIIPCSNHAHKPCISTMYINTIPCTSHVPYQASTVYHNRCINHEPTPIQNHASTMYFNVYHMPQPSTMYPSTNHVPYHVSTMYINNVHQHMYHTMYHIQYTMKFVSPI